MFTMHFNGDEPLYEALYEHIKDAVATGRMKEGEKLPSKRDLARHLGLSVNTVTAAYDQLVDEGYLIARERVGYFVAEIENLHKKIAPAPAAPACEAPAYDYDFDLNKNADYRFPDNHFKKCLQWAAEQKEPLNRREKEGLAELRGAVADYLKASRGVDVSAEDILLSAGMEYLLLILFALLPKDAPFRLENPGYIGLKKIFEQNRVPYDFMAVDEAGVDPDALTGERSIYLVTPSHQFPTGSILRVDRRIKLLNHVKATGSYIIEDDYDSEYKYYGRPIPALKSLDGVDRVIYMSNFSKSLSPTLRISFMVLPRPLMARYRHLSPVMNCPIPNLVQLALARYMREGHFERRLNRQRKIYDERRKIAAEAFLGDDLFSVDDKRAGMHFILTCKVNGSETDLLAYLKKHRVHMKGLSDFSQGQGQEGYPRLIVGYGNMSVDQLKEGLAELKSLIKNFSAAS